MIVLGASCDLCSASVAVARERCNDGDQDACQYWVEHVDAAGLPYCAG